MQATALGIEIGGTKLQVVVGIPGGEIGARYRFAVDRESGAAGIRRWIEQTLPPVVARYQPKTIGVGFGGPVDWRTGRICCSHHVEGWSGFPVSEWLGDLTGLRVEVDNDANVAALGEARQGAGTGRNPVFYVTLGSGVGGGLVVGNQIYHGAIPGEAEIGHVRLDARGSTVESRCSGWAVDRKIRELNRAEPDGLLAQLCRGQTGSEARQLGAALKAGDRASQRLLAETALDLAFALSHVTHLLHPEVVVLGGGLSLVGEPLRAAVAERLPAFVMKAFQPGPAVLLAGLGEDAVPVGALWLSRGMGG